MLFSSWLRNRSRPAATGFRPRLEAFEDRCLPSTLPYPTAATVSQIIADINYADQNGGTFTMNLKPGVTFDLTSVNNTTDGANGLPVIGGAKAVDLTILGNGDTIERIVAIYSGRSGKKKADIPDFRLFDVAAGASLTLDHVTLKDGMGTGGAVYSHGSVIVSYSTCYNTYTTPGGDIYSAGGTLAVSNSSLASGIINVSGTVTVAYSTLYGLSNSGGTATVSHTTGAVFHNESGTMTISDCTVSGGYATYGGGIYNAGTLTVSNSTISDNHAALGGGIYNHGTAVLSGCRVYANSAEEGYGTDVAYEQQSGGIYNDGTLTIKDSSYVYANYYSDLGDDVSNAGVLYLDSTSSIGRLDGNLPIPI